MLTSSTTASPAAATRVPRGPAFADLHDVVLGADVAEELGYTLGQPIVIAHGAADVSFAQHDDQPFRVVGNPRTHRHTGGSHRARLARMAIWPRSTRKSRAAEFTAFMVGMRDRTALLTMQRALNDYRKEPLLAIIPGVALKQLWDLVGIADRALMIVAAFVVFAGLLGMLTTILVSLNERRREMAILRSVGAGPAPYLHADGGRGRNAGDGRVLAGIAMTYALLATARPFWRHDTESSCRSPVSPVTDVAMLAGIVVAALAMGLLPAWRAYRNTLADGLTIRI